MGDHCEHPSYVPETHGMRMTSRATLIAAFTAMTLAAGTVVPSGAAANPSVTWPVPTQKLADLNLNLLAQSTPVHINFINIVGDTAYVATTNTLFIFNLSNPASPVLLSATPMPTDTSGVSVQGSVAYLCHYYTNQMTIWDVSHPASPVQLSASPGGTQPYDIFASGTTAYIADLAGKTLVTNSALASPFAPTMTSKVAVNKPDYVWKEGGYLYTANRLTASGASGGSVSVFSVADETHPALVGSVNLPTPIYSVAVYGSHVYATGYATGNVYVIDVSDPAQPKLVATVSNAAYNSSHVLVTNPGPWDIRILAHFAYVAEARSDWMEVFDLTNPASPVLVSQALLRDATSTQYLDVSSNLSTPGTYAVVGGWSSGVLQVWKLGV